MILIGSKAMDYWLDERVSKAESDWDIVADLSQRFSSSERRIEWHSDEDLDNLDLYWYTSGKHMIEIEGRMVAVLSLKGLALLRRSHAFRPWKFSRNMHLLKKCGWPNLELTEHDQEFLANRIKLTKEAFGDRVPSLNQSNEDFFDDPVEKHFDHDWIHEQVAYYDAPLYTRMKRDASLAKCERDMWQEFSQEDKIRTVLEECYVIGLERFIVPEKLSGKKYPPAAIATEWALRKVCTTLTSGWFRDFAIDNHQAILEAIDPSRVNTFITSHLTGVEAGV